MNNTEILIYQTEDGETKIQTRIENETVWLNQAQMAELFGKERSVITKHINNVFTEGELEENSNVQILHISGSDRPVKFYNLDVIISVGYRVKSIHSFGKISHQQAINKAHVEYYKYKEQIKNELSKVEKDFIKQIEKQLIN